MPIRKYKYFVWKKKFFSWIIKIFWKSEFFGGKFDKFWSSINLSWGHVRSHKKIGPDQFSRFDVYWSHTNRQTDKQSINIDEESAYWRMNSAVCSVLQFSRNYKIFLYKKIIAKLNKYLSSAWVFIWKFTLCYMRREF